MKENEKQAFISHLQQTSSSSTFSSDIETNYLKAKSLVRSTQVGAFLIAFLFGILAAPVAFQTNATQQINIFWLLVILLGAHFFSLLLWCVNLITKPYRLPGDGSWFTPIMVRFSQWMKISPVAMDCFQSLHISGKLKHWWGARLIHGCWLAYLIGGFLSATLFLMTHHVQFIWQTTLLTIEDFTLLTHILSVIPSWLGMAVPSLQDIQLSQISTLVQPDDTRKIWATWLLSSLVIYGIAVRGICLVVSQVAYQHQRKRLWFTIKSSTVTSTRSTIIDADNTTSNSHTKITEQPFSLRTAELKDATYYLFEWSHEIPSELAQNRPINMLNDAESQRRFIAEHPNNTILMIDSNSSPDRGSARFLKHSHTSDMEYYLYGNVFNQEWVNTLRSLGVEQQNIALWEVK
ncbi:DUF2868 domain-containing protein [Marinomonas communis]|uniref:DUF2868 domain-containing protein n=1 Tax=Marinomonas communis TaxID=28254 RepID=UPI001002C1E9|nr:DUF2868 domain-containing protein [Marinomonas communis]MCC4274213.1 DUF2868 domain-containing protein [Marinomonas communis]RUM55737.1 MAG: hypothetical protein DSY85_04300 [Marinomonas sp.]